jgi:hypothetical protein
MPYSAMLYEYDNHKYESAQIKHESATYIVQDSYSSMADSLIKAPYSCFLDESVLLVNDSVPFSTESADFIMNPPLFSQKTVGYLF